MSSVAQIFQPSSVEIQTVAASAKKRHPALASRIDKAAEILTSGSLQLDQLAWEKNQLARFRVASQSHGGAYIVCGLTCPCQDRRTKHCKHSIATSLLAKILNNRFNDDIQARKIDLAILPDRSFNCYAPKMGCVHARKLGSAYVFADAASMVRYSLWAARQDAAQASVNWTVPVAPLAVAA